MIKIDMWHGDKASDADRIDIIFYDLDCKYRGNIYRGGDCIGDYTADNTEVIERVFSQLIFNWH